jgi:hypothetical protein
MITRAFALRKTQPDDRRSGYTVTCKECGAVADIIASSGRLPAETVAKKFRDKGWRIGSHTGLDVCPTCEAKWAKAVAPIHAKWEKEFPLDVALDGLFQLSEPAEEKPAEERTTPMTTPTEAPKKQIRLSRSEEVAIYQTMLPHIKILGDGFCEYADDWNDDRVLKEANLRPEVNNQHIKVYRQDVFGRLQKQRHIGSTGVTLKALEKRVEDLEKLYLELAGRK